MNVLVVFTVLASTDEVCWQNVHFDVSKTGYSIPYRVTLVECSDKCNYCSNKRYEHNTVQIFRQKFVVKFPCSHDLNGRQRCFIDRHNNGYRNADHVSIVLIGGIFVMLFSYVEPVVSINDHRRGSFPNNMLGIHDLQNPLLYVLITYLIFFVRLPSLNCSHRSSLLHILTHIHNFTQHIWNANN